MADCNHPLNQLQPDDSNARGSICGKCGKGVNVRLPPEFYDKAKRLRDRFAFLVDDGDLCTCGHSSEDHRASKESRHGGPCTICVCNRFDWDIDAPTPDTERR